MTPVLDIDAILSAGGPSWLAYGLDRGGKRPEKAVLDRARQLHAEGVVLLSQRREPAGIAYLMRVREGSAAPVPAASRSQRRPAPMCQAPGCGAELTSSNTAGVCRLHAHYPEVCRCLACQRRRIPDPPSRSRRWSDEQVAAMRAMWRAGATYPDISRAFGLRESAVAAIVTGYCYRDVPGAVSDEERRARYGERGRRAA